MRDMGIYFEPPRSGDAAGWARMRLLAEFGIGYYTEQGRMYIERELVGSPPVSPRVLRRQLVNQRKCDSALALRRDARYLKEVRRQKVTIRRWDRLSMLQ
jgi:hypothetical protein